MKVIYSTDITTQERHGIVPLNLLTDRRSSCLPTFKRSANLIGLVNALGEEDWGQRFTSGPHIA